MTPFELGMQARFTGDHDAAVGYFANAPGPEGMTLQALSQLALGAGLPAWLLFEQRFDTPEDMAWPVPARRMFPRDDAYWCGDPAAGLVLWAEGGRGNVIQFSRYVADVAARFVLPVTFVVHPELVPLAGAVLVNEDVRVVPTTAPLEVGGGYEHASILSLPAIFGFKGWPDPPVPPLARTPRRRLPLRVGLNWAGNPSYWDDARRSFAAYPFAPLEDLIPKVHLTELQHLPSMTERTDPYLIRQFIDDTMGELATLDLVISTDTAMAHLAAHLGIPTWLLLHDACNWRWAEKGPATIGPLRYDSVRIFRSPTGCDLGGTVAGKNIILDVVDALRAEVSR